VKAKTWVRAALAAAALSAFAVMMPIDWCKVEGVCGTWWSFLCDQCP